MLLQHEHTCDQTSETRPDRQTDMLGLFNTFPIHNNNIESSSSKLEKQRFTEV